MPTIGGDTLVIAIQAVARHIRALEALQATEDEEAAADTAELLDACDRAAGDLRDAYDRESRTVINLPPYDELVGKS